MTLRFILGPAGSGKTTYCLNYIKEDLLSSPLNKPHILLVPEQATFQYELALASHPQLQGIIGTQVLSFRRLAWRVFQETGGGNKVHISDLGKHMVIRQFIENRKDQLQIFNKAGDFPGFIDSVSSAISEFKLYQISNQDLNNVLQAKSQEDSLLLSKLRELELIYSDLENYLADKFIDPDDSLSLLGVKAHSSPTIINSEIWLDGFFGFTPQEISVIKVLLQTAKRVNVLLTLDKRNIFQETNKTFDRLTDAALKSSVPIEKPYVLAVNEKPYRFAQQRDLSYLEENFFAPAAQPFDEEVRNIRIISSQNQREEVESVAGEIRRLCRDEGWRYKDIALLLRDFNNYDLLIETIFSDYEIPFFIDRKRTVMHHPLVELLRSALEAVMEDWSYQAVSRYFKTDLTNISRADADILENYILAYGIRGKRWHHHKDWKCKDNGNINSIRRRGIKELHSFTVAIRQCQCNVDAVAAIYNLLVELDVSRKLENCSLEAGEQGRLVSAGEHNQIWDGIMDILDQISETMGAQPFNLDSFIKIIDTGLQSLKLGLIPPGLDQVVVGSLERSRNPNLKGVFILGVLEGIFPARPGSEGIFNDFERDYLKDIGLELAPGNKEKVFTEEFLVYMALTRASHYLVLSYPLADSEGRALRPSSIIRRIKDIFPKLCETLSWMEPEFINHPQKALSGLGIQLRQAREGQPVEPVWWNIYQWLLQNQQGKLGLQRVVEGLFHTNQALPIDSLTARGLFGNPLRVSVSRLEKFQACPFSHFSTYGLGLREREIFKLSQPDLGRFYHKALESLANKLEVENLDWTQLDKKAIIILCDNIAEELIPQVQGEILLSSAKYKYLTKRFKKTIQRAALILAEHARRGKFRPVALEAAFGPQGSLPALKITLEDGTEMELVGRIDRVDAACKEGKYFLRVIDYKSGNAGLGIMEVYYGLKLQLLTYLDIVLTYADQLLQTKEALPAGILYFFLKDPMLSLTGPISEDELEKNILKELKMEGLLVADQEVFQLMDGETKDGWSPIIPAAINKDGQFYKNSKAVNTEQIEALRNHVRGIMKKAGEAVLKGDVSISPYEFKGFQACSYCSFLIVCQFDRQVENNCFRTIKPLSNEQVWELLSSD